MKPLRLSLALLVVIPALLSAQRGGGGGSGGTRRPGSGFSDSAEVRPLSRDDVNDANPLNLLVDKRKDLKLTDAQLAALKDASAKLKDRILPSLKTIDSLNSVMRLLSTSLADQDAARSARSTFLQTLKSIRDTYAASAQDAVTQLDPDQQKTANEVVQRQRDQFDKRVRERMGVIPGGWPPPL